MFFFWCPLITCFCCTGGRGGAGGVQNFANMSAKNRHLKNFIDFLYILGSPYFAVMHVNHCLHLLYN